MGASQRAAFDLSLRQSGRELFDSQKTYFLFHWLFWGSLNQVEVDLYQISQSSLTSNFFIEKQVLQERIDVVKASLVAF